MKTTSKIFAGFFFCNGSFSGVAAYFYGATHQWFIVALCAVMTLVLLDDAYNNTEANEKV